MIQVKDDEWALDRDPSRKLEQVLAADPDKLLRYQQGIRSLNEGLNSDLLQKRRIHKNPDVGDEIQKTQERYCSQQAERVAEAVQAQTPEMIERGQIQPERTENLAANRQVARESLNMRLKEEACSKGGPEAEMPQKSREIELGAHRRGPCKQGKGGVKAARKRAGNLKSYLITICLGLLLTVSSAITVRAEQAAQGELPAVSWSLIEDWYYYLMESGQYPRNSITPDGYYVNPGGVWQPRSPVILGTEFRVPEKAPCVTDAQTGTQEMKALQGEIQNVFRQRRIRITDSVVEYLEGEKETVPLGVYKNTASGSYRLSIRIALDKSSTELNQATSYDYAALRASLYQLMTTPDYLEGAIYSDWWEDNRRNINRMNGVWVGDSMVKYSVGNGCGCFHICLGGQK